LSTAPSLPPDFRDPEPQPPQEPAKRPLWKRLLLWGGAALLLVILLVFGGIEYILHSNRVHRYILNTAQQKATESLGSDVKVGNYALNFSGISPTIELYNVVVAGGDPYPNPPLLMVDHIRVGVRIVSVVNQKWYLSDVTVNHPVVRVFVDKRGNDNLPQTKSSGQKSNTSLFDLAVQHALLDRGEVYYNNRKSVLNADLHDVEFQSSFDNAVRKYTGRLAYSNGHLQMENFNSIGHDLVAFFDFTPNEVVLRNAVLRSGNSQFTVNATLSEYATQPKMQAEYVARLDTGEFRHILKNPTLPAGLVDLNGKVQYAPQPNRPMMDLITVQGRLASKVLNVTTPSFRGEIRNVGANYSLENGNADVRQMHALVLGGDVNGHLTMRNVTGASKSHLTATLKGVSLAQAKAMLNSPAMKQVGMTGSLNADTDATWGKSFDDLVAKVNATLQSRVTPAQARGQAVPINGVIRARYSAVAKQVTLTDSYVNMPQTSLNLNGTVSDRSSLQVQLQANDLRELEAIAATFQTNAQPLGLYGTAQFNGAVTGSTSAPHVTGRLTAMNLRVKGSAWRVLRTDVDASPSQANLLNGELDPEAKGRITFNLRAGLDKWSFTKDSPFQVGLNANQLDVANLAKAAGSQAPVAGTLNVNVQAQGTQLSPVGNGTIELSQAKVAGQPIQTASVKFQGTGDVVHTNLAVRLPAGTASGAVDYFPKQQGYSGQIQANGIRLDLLQAIKDKNLQLTGVLNLNASGRGTVQDPQLVATAEIPSLVVQGQKIEGIKLETNVANHVANVAVDSKALNTNLRGRATVNLTGNYETVATLDTRAIPFAPLVAIYAPEQAGNITGQTEIHANLRGPLTNKAAVNAHITIPTLQVNYKNAVQIGAPQPIQLDYTNGVLDLQKSALRGTGTNLQFQGSVPVLDRTAPVSLLLQGTVDLQLAEILNPDLTSAGQLQFDINSYGQRSDPNVEGQIRVVNASLATGDAPLGLQNGNGVLTLTRNRLDVTSFQGTVGGGELIARGGVNYRPAIGFDLAMTARAVRMLYPEGIRSGLGGNVTLTGTPETSYLRGQVNVQQVSLTPDFDLMSMMGQFGGTVASPPTQSFTDNMQLDIRLSTPNGIDLVSRELSLQGGMNLNVRGTASNPVLLGRVNLNDGDLIFHGNRYLLQEATIDFVNPTRTQPVFNAAITTTIQQYNISMRFEGPVDLLRTSYNSDPALPPADIINLLAFGQTTEAAAANPNPPGTLGAESAIASAVAGQVTNRLQKIAGISQLSIDPTLSGTGTGAQSNPGATVTIQQRVTSQIFVTFSTDVTSTQGQVVQLEYRLSPRFGLSGTRDQNGGFAMDTRIRKQW
jgi:translocation and assembly module TamB